MVDNYAWLREKSNPEVRAYLESENAYTDSIMKPTEPLQKKLYDEMLSRIKETDVEVPYREGDYFYYLRTEAGKQYNIRCRKKASMDAPEEVLLDINELAKGQVFMTVAAFAVSPDFILAVLALPCRSSCRCAVFRRWKTFDRPGPPDRRDSRRLQRQSHRLSRRIDYKTI